MTRLCTHIIIGFAKIKDGLLFPMMKEDEQIYQEIVALKQKSPEFKVLLSVGGANNDLGFRGVIRTLEQREEFALHSAKYLQEFGLDGIDLDWECEFTTHFSKTISICLTIFFYSSSLVQPL